MKMILGRENLEETTGEVTDMKEEVMLIQRRIERRRRIKGERIVAPIEETSEIKLSLIRNTSKEEVKIELL